MIGPPTHFNAHSIKVAIKLHDVVARFILQMLVATSMYARAVIGDTFGHYNRLRS